MCTKILRDFHLLRIELAAGSDRGTQNLPTSNEITSIILYEYSEISFPVMRVYFHDNNGHRSHGDSIVSSVIDCIYIGQHHRH
jgi:hypothetical protein